MEVKKDALIVPEKLKDHHSLIEQLLTLQTEVNALREDRKALLIMQDEYDETLESLRIHQEELRTQNETLLLANAEVERLSQNYKALFDLAPVGYVVLNEFGAMTEVNRQAEHILKQPKNKLIGKDLSLRIDKYDRDAFRKQLQLAHDNIYQVVSLQVRLRQHHPTRTLLLEMVSDGCCFRISINDISELIELQQHFELASHILEDMHEGVMICDENTQITFVNRAFTEVTGYTLEDARGKTPQLLSSGKHDKHFYAAMWSRLKQTGLWRGEIWNKRKSGEIYVEWLTISRMHHKLSHQQYFIGVFSDISDRKYNEIKLLQMAHFDALTELPNRILLRERMQLAMAMAKREHEHMALLFIDLDKFKKVNDNHGHQEGDWLLKEASKRMKDCIREQDTLARLGGDEFAIVLTPPINYDAAESIAQRIITTCEQAFKSETHQHHISASVGIALYPEDGSDTDSLLRNADIAMYQVKDTGRGAVMRYQHDRALEIAQHNRLEQLIRSALANRTVSLRYQPQVYSLDNRLAGFEALVRIPDESGTLVSPALFIPVAEETGLISALTDEVIRLALAQQRQWVHELGLTAVKLSINLSIYQVRDTNFAARFLSLIQEYQLKADTIGIEITESQAIENYEDTVRLLKVLRQAGVILAIDDFGAGYSSLTHLKHLPVDILKVDKAFIDDIPGDSGGEHLVQSILSLAASLGLHVVAEGVETPQQLSWLQGQRCEIIQGYVYAPPVAVEEATRLLRVGYVNAKK